MQIPPSFTQLLTGAKLISTKLNFFRMAWYHHVAVFLSGGLVTWMTTKMEEIQVYVMAQ